MTKSKIYLAAVLAALTIAGPAWAQARLGERYREADARAEGIATRLDTITRATAVDTLGDDAAAEFVAELRKIIALQEELDGLPEGSEERLARENDIARAQIEVQQRFERTLGVIADRLNVEIPRAESDFKLLLEDPHLVDASTRDLARGAYSPRVLAAIAIQEAKALREYLTQLRIASTIATRSRTRLAANQYVGLLRKAGVVLAIPRVRPCTLTDTCGDLETLPVEPGTPDPATGEFEAALAKLEN